MLKALLIGLLALSGAGAQQAVHVEPVHNRAVLEEDSMFTRLRDTWNGLVYQSQTYVLEKEPLSPATKFEVKKTGTSGIERARVLGKIMREEQQENKK